MLKFDYDRFRKDLEESAVENKMSVKEFIKDFDKDLGSRAPSKTCINVKKLFYQEAAKNPELVKHVRGCNYCRRFVKILFFTNLTRRERLKLISETFPDQENRPHWRTIFSIYSNSLPDDCYELVAFLHWNRLSEELKSHRKSCKRCAAIMEFFQKMELPELT